MKNNKTSANKRSSTKIVNASREVHDEDAQESLADFIYEQTNKFYLDHIPIDSLKDLPDAYLYYFGTVAYLVSIGMFIYFLYINYQSSITQAYISLEESSGDCNSVPIVVNGVYNADVYGNWVGTPDYLDSNAIYSLSFSNFEINTVSQYTSMMNAFYTSLNEVGEAAKHNNVANNLVFWMAYIQYYSVQYPDATDFAAIGYGQLQSFSLTGNPAVVFSLGHALGNPASPYGVCDVNSYASFDQSNAVFTSTYQNISSFLQSEVCLRALTPSNFGYDAGIDDDVFVASLDVRTLAIAMGVNYGILDLEILQPVSRYIRNFTYNGTSYTIGEYFDTRYPLMISTLCITNTSIIPVDSSLPEVLCMYTVGSTFALPLLNHYGGGDEKPSYCSCDTIGQAGVCQLFNLMPGLAYFNLDHTSVQVNPALLFQDGFNDTQSILSYFGLFDLLTIVSRFPSYAAFNRAAYNASYIAVNSDYTCDADCLAEAFEFCTINSTLYCSVYMFNAVSDVSQAVSTNKYQLQNGSCANSMAIPQSAWDNLVNNPPVAFTQTYYECYESDLDSFINAVGVASGNTAIFIPFAVFMVLPLVYFSLVAIRQVPPKEEYKKQEKDQVLEILALLLLRLRDGKTRGVKSQGVLLKLVQEMITAAKEEGGYPDSDDEEDDDPKPPQDSLISEDMQAPKRTNMHPNPAAYYQDSVDHYGASNQPVNATSSVRKGRSRMAVLTKNLQPLPQPQYQQQHQPRTVSFALHQSILSHSPFNFARQSSVNPQQPRESEMVSVDTGFLGYLFSSNSKKPAKQEEPAVCTIESFLDLNTNMPPEDILVLNQQNLKQTNISVRRSQRILRSDEAEVLLDDLGKLFFETMAYHLPADTGTANILHQGREDSTSSVLSTMVKNKRDLDSYRQAKLAAARLTQVDVGYFLDNVYEDHTFFIKLANVLCMHASIELDMEMKDIAAEHANRIAYNVGQRLLTAQQLQNII